MNGIFDGGIVIKGDGYFKVLARIPGPDGGKAGFPPDACDLERGTFLYRPCEKGSLFQPAVVLNSLVYQCMVFAIDDGPAGGE